jgi:hypothetical protein
MPAPPGNQFAVGNSGGRPRIHKREELMKDLLKWSLLPHSFNLNRWCGDKDLCYEYLQRWAKEDDEFRLILLKVKGNLAVNREQMLCQGYFHPVAYKAGVNTYDKIMYEQWKEEKEYEYGLKNKAEVKGNVKVTVVQNPWEHDDEECDNTAPISLPPIPDSGLEGA